MENLLGTIKTEFVISKESSTYFGIALSVGIALGITIGVLVGIFLFKNLK